MMQAKARNAGGERKNCRTGTNTGRVHRFFPDRAIRPFDILDFLNGQKKSGRIR